MGEYPRKSNKITIKQASAKLSTPPTPLLYNQTMDTKTFLRSKFPQAESTADVLSTYFDQIEFNPSENQLGKVQLTQLFRLFIKDYLDYKLDPDWLTQVCEKLTMLMQKNTELTSSPIGLIILDLAELELLLRMNPEIAAKTLNKALERYHSISKI